MSRFSANKNRTNNVYFSVIEIGGVYNIQHALQIKRKAIKRLRGHKKSIIPASKNY